MATVSLGGAYVTDLFVVQRLPMFFNQNEAGARAGYQILLTLSTQLIGYSCAGMARRFLVYPSQMIWPGNLAAIALTKALHHDDGRVREAVKGPFGRLWGISRNKFMMISMAAMFVYFWLPDYLFQALSYFSWITWLVGTTMCKSLTDADDHRLQNQPWWHSLLAVSQVWDSTLGPPLIGTLPRRCLTRSSRHCSRLSILPWECCSRHL